MSDFFKRNRILVGMILGALYALSFPMTDLHAFYAKLYPNMNNWCFYIPEVIGLAMWGGIVAGRTEDDEQVIHRMAFGAFIGIMIGSLVLLPIAAPINKLVSWFWDGALIGLAYRWAFKGALIGMILGILIGITILLIKGLFPVNLEEIIALLVVGTYLGAGYGARLWVLFGETPSSSR
jgi:hypothetical protein